MRVLPAVLLICGACSKPAAVGAGTTTAPTDVPADADAPSEPVVTDDANGLLFSFVDAQGNIQAVGSVAEVPEPVKAHVLVVDLNKTPEQRQAHRTAFFADLTTKRPDGNYAVTAVSRYDGSTGQAASAALPPPDGTVLVYSAQWCGYCKKTKAWMKEHQVPFVERDVEKTPGAQAELSAKLRAANTPAGGIPVIDWAGTLVMGFDKPTLERLLKSAPAPGTGVLTKADAGPTSATP